MKWHKGSVQKLINMFKEFGTIDRNVGSGRPVTVTTAENEEIVEQLICSQDDFPRTHKSLREIEKITGNQKDFSQKYGKEKLIQANQNTKNERRKDEPRDLVAERFSHKRSIEKCVFEDENDFTLEVPINP